MTDIQCPTCHKSEALECTRSLPYRHFSENSFSEPESYLYSFYCSTCNKSFDIRYYPARIEYLRDTMVQISSSSDSRLIESEVVSILFESGLFNSKRSF